MGSHTIAWIAVGAATLLGLFALYQATRGPRWRRTRIALAVLLAVLLVVPAPVPGYDGHYAPAFLVFSFEWLFQQSGQPRFAGVILVASGLVTVAVLLLAAVLSRGKPRRAGRTPASRPAQARREKQRPVA